MQASSAASYAVYAAVLLNAALGVSYFIFLGAVGAILATVWGAEAVRKICKYGIGTGVPSIGMLAFGMGLLCTLLGLKVSRLAGGKIPDHNRYRKHQARYPPRPDRRGGTGSRSGIHHRLHRTEHPEDEDPDHANWHDHDLGRSKLDLYRLHCHDCRSIRLQHDG